MNQRIAHIALVVNDYDEAIQFYTEQLDFQLKEDTDLGEGNRWVILAPPGAKECSLVLRKAKEQQQIGRVGNQTGGGVFLFLFTDDFDRDYEKMRSRKVEFIHPPTTFPYGKVAVFEDLYGNQWDLIEPSASNKGVL